MSKEKVVRKILRSIPRKFNIKVTTIKEAQYLSSMKVDELVESLQTFEVAISDKSERRTRALPWYPTLERIKIKMKAYQMS